MWVVYSGEVRGEVGTRSRMCYVEWVVWVHGFCHQEHNGDKLRFEVHIGKLNKYRSFYILTPFCEIR